MNKRKFTLKMIQEIKDAHKHGFVYQSVVLMATFAEYCRLELGINIINDRVIERGLAQIRISYVPSGLIWLDENAKLHGKKYKQSKRVCPLVLINQAEKIINDNKAKIPTKAYLSIDKKKKTN